MSLLISWLVLSLAFYVTALVLPGFHIRSFGGAIVVAAIFGLLNFFLGWLFFTVLAIATLGIGLLLAFITRWVVNAILLVITDKISDSLDIDGFGWALGGALMISILSAVGDAVLGGMF